MASYLPIPCCLITHQRYSDDSHDRFYDKPLSEKLLDIFNHQDPRKKYTAEYKNEEKELNCLDVLVRNSGNRSYSFNVYRKKAITNVQVKNTFCHGDMTKDGIFKGFLSRAKAICSLSNLQAEIDFLIHIFLSNGYSRQHSEKLLEEFNRPRRNRNSNREPHKYT